MKDTALYREWRHGWSLRPPASFIASMRRLYNELGTETCRDLVSIGPIVIEGEAFQLHDGGEWAFLTPVWWCDPDEWRYHVWGPIAEDGVALPWPAGCAWTPEMAWRQLTEIVDIVAWHPATPGCWARRTGDAAILGEVEVVERPLRVHQTPYGWLKAGGEGVCFLDRDRPAIASVLRLAEQVVADSREHARELRDICARPYPAPRIGYSQRQQS